MDKGQPEVGGGNRHGWRAERDRGRDEGQNGGVIVNRYFNVFFEMLQHLLTIGICV